MISYRLFGEIAAPTPKSWLIQDWFGAGDLAVVRGAPGSGKTTLIAGLASAIAAGKQWFGRDTTGGAVMWIAAERSADTLRTFQAALGSATVPLAVVDSAVNLSVKETADDLIDASKALASDTGYPVRALIIDTLSRTISGQDENSASVMSLVMQHCNEITKATGATVILLHHENKSGGTRGSTAIDAAADCVIEVSATKKHRVAKIVKANAAQVGAEIAFTIEPAGHGLMAVPVKGSSGKSTKLAEIIRQLASSGEIKRSRVLSEARTAGLVTGDAKVSAEAFRKLLISLRTTGEIEFDNDTIRIVGTEGYPHEPHPTSAPLRGARGGVGVASPILKEHPHRTPTNTPTAGDVGVVGLNDTAAGVPVRKIVAVATTIPAINGQTIERKLQ